MTTMSHISGTATFSRRVPAVCPLTCAHLRTFFTVAAPGFAYCAAAHLLGEVGGQCVLTAPVLRRHQEALSLLSWRLWQRRQQSFIWEWSIPKKRDAILEWMPFWNENVMSKAEKRQNPERPLTHQHIDSCQTPNRPCRNIWSCLVCSNSLHSDRHPAWSTRWYLQDWGGGMKSLFWYTV